MELTDSGGQQPLHTFSVVLTEEDFGRLHLMAAVRAESVTAEQCAAWERISEALTVALDKGERFGGEA
ncbi:hypothetical protein A6A06_23595 [Streptomyces sp. CB02923]|uniref:hypothetical protein n=1 Tax=Streptomyces sp. CB02923 TaxID=1718985 RepID=UPI00093A91C2|nr:hypothetical protein [Streptomyces sp. CB02923]OKI00153.1 hypothetical protein A6A06_23595 [Streptomyces sp. CB02923]